jgi:ABC-type transport system involved in multi-copper enzyme maturation permease subunit
MFAAIKSEIRKILTLRTTYVIILLATLLTIFYAFYATGLKLGQSELADPHFLQNQVAQAVLLTGLLGSLVGVLLVTQEYRYNTIMYTLTASNSRTKTFLAKFIVVTLFAVCFTLFIGVLSPFLSVLAIHIKDFQLIPQKMNLLTTLWQALVVGWGYSIMGFVLAMIIRVQVGAISAMFLFPAMVEPLLGLLLKKQAIDLPYNALQAILGQANADLTHVSALHAVGAFAVYAVLGLVISWQLFVRRDAA